MPAPDEPADHGARDRVEPALQRQRRDVATAPEPVGAQDPHRPGAIAHQHEERQDEQEEAAEHAEEPERAEQLA